MKRIKEFKLIGLALPEKTTNKNGQSNIDCGNLWQQFQENNYLSKIPERQGDEIFAVYHGYEGDHNAPFSYFIGCKVSNETPVPETMDSLIIPKGEYQKIIARGKMPNCVTDTWKEIWQSDIDRSYTFDFEVYDERSKDWNDAEIDIFISVV